MPRTALAKIASIGTYVPPGLLTNNDLEQMVDTSDEWIMERTGIRERHIVEKGVTTSDMAAIAAKIALERASVSPSDVDLIIVATITPDMILPATACLVQEKIGANAAWGFDLSAACSGFLYALTVGSQFVHNRSHKNVLVIGMEVMSTIVDYTDRQTCIIFGDGGGAVLLQPSDKEEDGCFIDYLHIVDGSGSGFLTLPGGGSKYPTSIETVQNKLHYVHQDGRSVFKYATRKMPEICANLLAQNGLTGDDVDIFISHQANKRIISAAAERLKLPEEKVLVNIEKYGNTTSGTIPLAIQTALDESRLKRGDLVLFAAMGAGFSAGATLVRW